MSTINWNKVADKLNDDATYWQKSQTQSGPQIAAILVALRDAIRAGMADPVAPANKMGDSA